MDAKEILFTKGTKIFGDIAHGAGGGAEAMSKIKAMPSAGMVMVILSPLSAAVAAGISEAPTTL
ncbi:hypothetical protein NKI46_26385 [Mesorhizobium sp. M0615]|uniref:hypothetical protein n=1 Tax=unclassified Mesorhizobium TaxID=325217 RepID=UPI0003CF8524|nr:MULTISPECIES: hypothetical protein [unclassified Mesorhizobium]ESY10506.1 hypothetical protein X752_14600 [Mesorhizobium sp. LNJC398B00]ESY35829.1 hypothetical protein X748_15145 [Mesorhizobium sp. LNJC386A00]